MNITRKLIAILCFSAAISSSSQAGSIYLTGHDVLLHNGQSGYDNTILNYLRGAGTGSEIAASAYTIGLVRGNEGSVGAVGTDTLEGFGSITTRDISSFTNTADFTSFLDSIDVLVIPSHRNCGGCDLSTADADILAGFAPEITTYFNAGGDIFANSGANDPSFYDFLPASTLASAASISGSFGFTETAAGAAIGITSGQINGFATHNRFFDFDSDFTVFETRSDEVISIGIRDARIDDGGVVPQVPIPAAVWLFGSGLLGLIGMRRSKI